MSWVRWQRTARTDSYARVATLVSHSSRSESVRSLGSPRLKVFDAFRQALNSGTDVWFTGHADTYRWAAQLPGSSYGDRKQDEMRVERDVVFAAVAEQRRYIASVLDGLSGEELATPSLCSGWDIKTVGAHIVSVFADSFWVFMRTAARHASLARAIDDLARRRARDPVTEITHTLREHADFALSPPLFGPLDALADILVHTGDMCIPLGLPFEPNPCHAALALDFLTGPWPFGFVPAGLLRGLSLHATDANRTWRQGAQIRGTARALIMCVAGRNVLSDELDGPGLAILRQRSGW